MTFNDYNREMALVVEYRNPDRETAEIIAVGRLSKLITPNEAEFALIVSDEYQHLGIGTKLLETLVQIGRDEKLDRICAEILADNIEMQKTAEKIGFKLARNFEEGTYTAELEL